jgi:hypothetical protein
MPIKKPISDKSKLVIWFFIFLISYLVWVGYKNSQEVTKPVNNWSPSVSDILDANPCLSALDTNYYEQCLIDNADKYLP